MEYFMVAIGGIRPQYRTRMTLMLRIFADYYGAEVRRADGMKREGGQE